MSHHSPPAHSVMVAPMARCISRNGSGRIAHSPFSNRPSRRVAVLLPTGILPPVRAQSTTSSAPAATLRGVWHGRLPGSEDLNEEGIEYPTAGCSPRHLTPL